ncbi:MAG: site-specific integrase [Desulfosporosinus sp.]|nr:site-specific integrase [Desulfosporosinus sp.]
MMKNSKLNHKLFFSETNEFLNKYLPNQAAKSVNTINTYRDALTVFRRYVTDVKKISIKKFPFVDCTHDFLLDYLAHLKASGCAKQLVTIDWLQSELIYGTLLMEMFQCSQLPSVLQMCHF